MIMKKVPRGSVCHRQLQSKVGDSANGDWGGGGGYEIFLWGRKGGWRKEGRETSLGLRWGPSATSHEARKAKPKVTNYNISKNDFSVGLYIHGRGQWKYRYTYRPTPYMHHNSY